MSFMPSRLSCEPLVAEAVEATGCQLYALFLTPGRSQHLTVLIDKPSGADADDCEKVFDQLRFTCWRTDEYLKNKSIEVATPGLDRLLLYPEHYQCSIGRWIEVKISEDSKPKRSIQGCLLESDNDSIRLKAEDDTIHLIRYNDIARAKWIFEYTASSPEEA